MVNSLINKKRIKLIVYIVISIFMLITIIPIKTYAQDKMVIELQGANGKPGDEITVNLKLSNNPGVRILGGKISFDRTKLEYVSCELKGLEKAKNKDIQYNDKSGNIVFYATAERADAETINDNDTIAEIKLKIKNDATGTAEVKINMEDVAIGINQAITDYEQKNATITIEGTAQTQGNTQNNSEQTNNEQNSQNGNSQNGEQNGENSEENGENSNQNNENNVDSENNEEENKEQENKEEKQSPTTGDIAVGVLIALVIISAIGITIILIKRKKKKQ